MLKLNCLGMNYCENLLDMRLDLASYTHLNFDCNQLDAWNLHFTDDCARMMEGIVFEDEYSPVVRLEFARRMMKGMAATQYPGTKSYYAFRHRSGGKTDIMLDDSKSSNEGRVMLSNWGDEVTGQVKIGFRTEHDGKWQEINSFKYTDDPDGAGTPGVVRSARYWNESPYIFNRRYTADSGKVDFTGRYWFSDEDMPFEFGFESPDADKLQIVIGDPGKAMFLLVDKDAPGIIQLPDRKTVFTSDKNGTVAFEKPGFNYFILRKKASWCT
jgi:hypothetical protein